MKKFGMILLVIIVSSTTLLSEIKRKEYYPPKNYCRATATVSVILKKIGLGPEEDCEVHCPSGTLARCTASFFTASCGCYKNSGSPKQTILIPGGISNIHMQIANDFINFCNQSSSINIQTLGNYVLGAKEAIVNNDQAMFSDYEIAYDELFDQLSPSEIMEIENWINNYQ
ncbi:MAG TPA: hypothetical protein PL149_00285 [Candidatus Kapabacteria bacterium]|jgi:hypothetical protein|nr:hypothetical protein [Ignavibacteria bacterium]HPU22583.1 hypothetical protein [Candidatus Kapabacteria bacterium]